MSSSDSQVFLRELDKKLWTAADKLRSNLDVSAVEMANPVASVCDRRTLKSGIARRQPREFRTNRRRIKPRKTSDGRRPTLQLPIDPANLAGLVPAKPLGDDGLIDLIATIPFQRADLHAKDILGHIQFPRSTERSDIDGGERCPKGSAGGRNQFALAEGKKGGQYFTPKAIVSLIVEMIEP